MNRRAAPETQVRAAHGAKGTPMRTAWYRQVASVLPLHVLLKSVGTPLFIAFFFAAYFYVLKNAAYTVTVMPLTGLDRLIGFEPLAMPLYVSLWVYVSLPSAVLATRRELYVYGAGMSVTCLAALAIFYFWPTAVPPPDIDWARYPGVEFLKHLDASGNACPSLHVATAVFSGCWLHDSLRRFDAPHWVLSTNWAWCFGIVYSALATRQHVLADVLGGLALGLLGAWLSLRRRGPAAMGEP